MILVILERLLEKVATRSLRILIKIKINVGDPNDKIKTVFSIFIPKKQKSYT